jgi:hypothetical protein
MMVHVAAVAAARNRRREIFGVVAGVDVADFLMGVVLGILRAFRQLARLYFAVTSGLLRDEFADLQDDDSRESISTEQLRLYPLQLSVPTIISAGSLLS